jgi:hypothetical protein
VKQPVTVCELIKILGGFDQDAVVMVECEDYYYSGPVTSDDVVSGEALIIGEHEYKMPDEHKPRHVEESWGVRELDSPSDYSHLPVKTIKPAVLIKC